jgi:hypothetical protein
MPRVSFENNIALEKSVTASRSLSDQMPSNAIDGTSVTWGASSSAPQWTDIDLGKPSTILAVRLEVQQHPKSDTAYHLWAGCLNVPLRQAAVTDPRAGQDRPINGWEPAERDGPVPLDFDGLDDVAG